MPYAEVAVDFRSAPGKTFSYGIPPGMDARPGNVVEVPFGSRHLPGFIFELTAEPSFSETKDLTRVIGVDPWLSEAQLRLARWLSVTYFSSLYSAAALMVPPGFRQKVQAVYEAPPERSQTSLQSMDQRQADLLAFVQERGQVSEPAVKKRFGGRNAEVVLGQLVRRRLVLKTWAWLKPTVKAKFAPQAELVMGKDEALAEAARLGVRAKKQAAVLAALAAAPQGILEVAEVGGASSALGALVERGLVRMTRRRVDRDPLAGRRYPLTRPLELTQDQERAWAAIEVALEPPSADPSSTLPPVFLLQGVTGSGKTELYLRALEKVVASGGRGIVLVPEISLTPQTIERFSGRFPGRVGVLHSRISAGEQFDEWWRIKNGDFDVVVGSRGAIFAPQPDLRLIVLDEEHEWTYKQQDPAPRYHAREAAVKLAELTGATVILGSATPQLESYYRARTGEYRLLELPHRVPSPSLPGKGREGEGQGPIPLYISQPILSPLKEKGAVGLGLPQVRIVDMREELKSGNRSVFSRHLRRGIEDALEHHQQIILFLNRRGAANFVQCRDCGYVIRCRRCSTTMTYHAEEGSLRCHQCNYQAPAPTQCPQCWGPHVRYVGMGTERLELEVEKAFPQAAVLRWDSDVTQDADSHEALLHQFLDREADILIGTQMIAKGLHLPGVTLVGVVNADIGLHATDFRAGERVFEVICQVAGRSGRGDEPGRVIVQTYSPGHYAIQAAARQDYRAFYEEELRARAETGLPPYSRMARLVYSHTNVVAARREAERVAGFLQARLQEWGFPNTKVIGPAPAPLERLRGRYRWHIIIQAPDPIMMLDNMPLPDGWVVDIDPQTMA